MRIPNTALMAAIDITHDSSATADFIRKQIEQGRVVIGKSDAARSIVFTDGRKGRLVFFSSLSPKAVRKQMNENGFIIV